MIPMFAETAIQDHLMRVGISVIFGPLMEARWAPTTFICMIRVFPFIKILPGRGRYKLSPFIFFVNMR